MFSVKDVIRQWYMGGEEVTKTLVSNYKLAQTCWEALQRSRK